MNILHLVKKVLKKISNREKTFNIVTLFNAYDNTVRFDSIGLIEGFKYISIGSNTTFQRDLYLTAWD